MSTFTFLFFGIVAVIIARILFDVAREGISGIREHRRRHQQPPKDSQ